jgi:hypothetical protein
VMHKVSKLQTIEESESITITPVAKKGTEKVNITISSSFESEEIC